MSSIDVPLHRGGFGSTSRKDNWWLQPLLVFLGLSSFMVYSTWAAFQNEHFRFGPYLSPFYSPELLGSPDAWFGPKPGWWPAWMPFSAAILILWAPGGFRFTCYYYRGAYYKAFWADPINCAVGEPRQSYCGESAFPLIMQNIHRYFFYISIFVWMILAHDLWKALWFPDGFGIGVGTLVLATNLGFLGAYLFGCHSFRHLIGGRLDHLSKAPVRLTAYNCVSCLNARHMRFAWLSLFSVGFSDVYVRLCSMGIWTDWRLF